jgi:hypothetical protein
MLVVALALLAQGRIAAQAPTIPRNTGASHVAPAAKSAWTPARTADGRPDLQGIWDFRSATPLERPARFAGKDTLTAEEVEAYEQRAAEREDGRPPDDRGPAVGHRAGGWTGKTVKSDRDLADRRSRQWRIPPFTPGWAARRAPTRAQPRQPATRIAACSSAA